MYKKILFILGLLSIQASISSVWSQCNPTGCDSACTPSSTCTGNTLSSCEFNCETGPGIEHIRSGKATSK